MKIIGILGVAGSGKTLVSKHLVDHHGFARVRFAEPLKRMLKLGLGLTDAQVDGDEKMTPIADFGGATARHMMQTLGTEWGRRLVFSDIWINVWKRDTAKAGPLVVVDDVRFPNEAATIKAMGGTLWRVYRPGLNTQDHISERAQAAIEEDAFITNATTIPALLASVDSLVRVP
ncbi:hypothetical protein UFOVP119_90 [uncultured Caudovirales phage]|uniref:Uncharacterized protein n=1 Tax=uncultured Caudovirales phage TaxID=2100421 RepID=A0A6J5LB53_9CAUD|nr:hypothetical protein UFOVP119_90 [uncultured Caudovirales phage]